MKKRQDLRIGQSLRIAVAQLNPCVGDIGGNLAKAKQALAKAAAAKADIALFSELFLSGYPAEDLLLKPAFIQACTAALHELARETAHYETAAIIGAPVMRDGALHNAVLLLEGGEIIAERHKIFLPNYDEFDERRVFAPGQGAWASSEPVLWRGLCLGLPVCEDIWADKAFCKNLARKGAELFLVANASPYAQGKPEQRLEIAAAQALQAGAPLIYCNQFGGQDELMFDGGSFAVDGAGECVLRAEHFAEDLAFSQWQKDAGGGAAWHCREAEKQPVLTGEEADYSASMLALRDYAHKNGFKQALLGLSGGIDSALCAVMAADALGAENIQTIMLPYHYTGQDSLADAKACAEKLGCAYAVLPIGQAVAAAGESLAPFLDKGGSFAQIETAMKQGKEVLWLENLQSRMRGLFLMAVSNQTGALLISTGNKSEMAVGFATLYGDMNGGYNPIKNIYKMEVYALSRWRNLQLPHRAFAPASAPIPQNIIDKEPSAELSQGQRDADRLPPYPVLDAILQGLVEEDLDCAAVAARGYSQDMVERVEYLLYIAEYKRHQAAPGVKITAKSFGKVRRYPITNRFRTAAKP